MSNETNMLVSVVALKEAKVENNSLVVRNTITNNYEKYSLSDIPDAGTSLVQYQKTDVLGGIELNRLLFELNLCGDLYDIVYNACYGIPGLHANASDLRLRFLDALRESDIAASEFKAVSSGAIDLLMLAFNLLGESDAESRETALSFFGDISSSAEGMKEKSATIKAIFETVLSDTETTLSSVIEKNEQFYEKFDEMKKQQAELKASYASYESLAETYKIKSTEMSGEIEETKTELKGQEDRAYKLAIVSAVMSGVAGIAQGVGSALAKSGININSEKGITEKDASAKAEPSSTQAASGTASPITRDETSEKKYTAANNKLNELNKKKAEIDQKISENDKMLNDKNYGGKTEQEIIDSNKVLKEERNKINDEIITESGSATAIRASLEALGYGFDKTSGALAQISEKAETKSTSLRDDLKDLRKQKHAIDILYAENLAKVKETAVRLKNSITERTDVAVAIDSLILAIAALNNVIAFLDTITLFWAKVEIACKALQDSNAAIVKLAARIKTPSFFKTATFVFPFYKSFAYWVALNYVFSEYLQAADKAHSEMVKSLNQNPGSREAGYDKAKGLAEKLSQKIGYEIVKTGETVATLERELKKS